MDRRPGAFCVIPAECFGVEFGDLLDDFGQMGFESSLWTLCLPFEPSVFRTCLTQRAQREDTKSHKEEIRATKIKQLV